MPESAVSKTTNQPTAEKPVNIIEQVNDLLEKIVKESKKFSKEDKINIASRVLEHSVEDGLKIIEKFNLTPKDIAFLVGQISFALKHPEVMGALFMLLRNNQFEIVHNKNLAEEEKKAKAEDIKRLKTNYYLQQIVTRQKNLQDVPSEIKEIFIKESLDDRIKPVNYSQPAADLVKEIDKVYGRFLAVRDFQNKSERADLPHVDWLIDRHFNQLKTAWQKPYHTAQVIEIASRLAKKSQNQEIIAKIEREVKILAKNDLVSSEDVSRLGNILAIQEGQKDPFEPARYKLIHEVYTVQKKLITDLLIKELEGSLSARGDGSVKYDPQSKRYEIVFPESSAKRLEILHQFSPEYTLEDMDEDEGLDSAEKNHQLYFNIANTKTKTTHIANEKGEIIPTPFDIYDLQSFQNRLFFMARVPEKADESKKVLMDETGQTYGQNYSEIADFKVAGGDLFLKGLRKKTFPFSGWTGALADLQGHEFVKSDSTLNLLPLNGKMYFQKFDPKKNEYIILDKSGQELARSRYEFEASDTVKIEDKLYFVAVDENGNQALVCSDGRIINDKYSRFARLSVIGGQLYFAGIDDKEGKLTLVKQNGQVVNKNIHLSHIEQMAEINQKLVYSGYSEGKHLVLNEKGVIASFSPDKKFWGNIELFCEVNKQACFVVKKNPAPELFSAVYGEHGQYPDTQMEEIYHIQEREGKLLIVGKNNGLVETRLVDIGNLPNLSEQEKKKLELLNLVNNPQKDQISQYLEEMENERGDKSFPSGWTEKKTRFEKSVFFAQTIADIIKKYPELFLKTMAAKGDTQPGLVAGKIFNKMFPELKKKESSWQKILSSAGNLGKELAQLPFEVFIGALAVPVMAILALEKQIKLSGGGKAELMNKNEILKLRDKIEELIVTGIYGIYNKETAEWEKGYFPVDNDLQEPIKETTITINATGSRDEIVLPKPLNSKIIRERVKGVKGKKQVDLATESNSLGEVTVNLNDEYDKIVYSLQYSKINLPPQDIDNQEYLRFRKQFETKYGSRFSEKIAVLPAEMKVFLQSIKDFTPKQKIAAIENYVREIGYYDVNNQQVSALKTGEPIEKQLAVMSERLESLRKFNISAQAKNFRNKKYAGVCADFALITATLLREAGFISGVATGLSSDEKSVQVKDNHAVAFAVWPGAKNNNQVVLLDGTPTDSTSSQLENLTVPHLPSLAEIEEQAQTQIEEVKAQAQEELARIEDILRRKNPDEIKKLTNGQLEEILNMILRYEVKPVHFSNLNSVLNAYWYSDVHNLSMQNTEEIKKVKDFLSRGIKEADTQVIDDLALSSENAGTYLFDILNNFADRFIKSKKVLDKTEALDLLEKIFESVTGDLSVTEKRAVAAIITYLRAKKILGGKKE